MEPSYNIEKKTSKMPMAVVSLIAVLSFGSAVALGMLYLNEKNNDQTESKSSTQVVEQSKPVEPKEVSLFETSQINELYTDIDKSKETTTYNAKVGKFTLELPNWLGIIQKLDGAGEGSIETNIQIGIRDGGLIALPAVPLEVRAIKTLHNEDLSTPDQFKEFIKNYGMDVDEASVNKPTEETVTFAGTKAIKYTTVGGMFNQSYTSFHKDDIVYIISTDADYEATSGIEKIVESSIKFN